jgi:hypothetical protein
MSLDSNTWRLAKYLNNKNCSTTSWSSCLQAHRLALTRPALCCLAAVAALGSLVGCDDGITPSLSGFRFDGASPDSATVLLLSTGFHDGDGDLSSGSLETFIDARPTSAGALPLLPMFLQSGVAENATDGRLEFVLELNVAEGSAPPSGSSFKLGIRATDAALNSSSTSEITLRLTY